MLSEIDMGVHWGSEWFQVKHDELKYCGVILLSKYPVSTGDIVDGKEACEIIIPDISGGFTFIKHGSKKEAENHTKYNALLETKRLISFHQERVTSLELDSKNRLFLMRNIETDREEFHSGWINYNNSEEIPRLNKKISDLKGFRNRKVKELVESDIRGFSEQFEKENSWKKIA